MLTDDAALNHIAITSFRNIADGDYIAARFASRAALLAQFLWASQQAIEKYLKCILLLNRIEAPEIGHFLDQGLLLAKRVQGFTLTEPTRKFIDHIDTDGRHRYQDMAQSGNNRMIVALDRTVWELRRFCTTDTELRRVELVEHKIAPRVRLPGGHLERIIDADPTTNYARSVLLWQNGFFGPRRRRTIRMRGWDRWTAAPLAMRPDLVDEVARYVKVPNGLKRYWRELAAEKRTS